MSSVGKITAHIGANTSGLDRGVAHTKKQLGGLGRQFAQVAGGLVGIGVGVAAFSKGISTLSDFGQGMSTVKAITSATDEEFQGMREEAKRLGSSTRYSATQAAEGMQFLARAGFDVNQVMAATADTLHLAQAGALELGRAADISSNILTAFGMAASEMTNVVDILAYTANRSNTNIEQLGEGMKFVAPISAGLGVSIEETAAAMGTLADAGIQGTLGGNALKRTLLTLASPSEALRKKMGGLTVRTDGLVAVMNELRKANVSVEEAAELFDKRTAAGVAVMIKATEKTGAFAEALQDVDGFAKQVAEEMDKNLKGALFGLSAALEGLIIGFGDLGTTGAIEGSVRALSEVIRGLTDNLESLVPVMKTVITLIGVRLAIAAIPIATEAIFGLAVAIGGGGAGALAGAAKLAITRLGHLGAAVKLLGLAIKTNPIGFLVSIITTAAVVAFSFRRQILGFVGDLKVSSGGFVRFRDVVVGAFGVIKDRAALMVYGMQEALIDVGEKFETVTAALETAFNAVFGEVEFSLENLIRVTAQSLDVITALWKGTGHVITNQWKRVFKTADEITADGVRVMKEHLLSMVDIPGVPTGPLEGFVDEILRGARAAAAARAAARAAAKADPNADPDAPDDGGGGGDGVDEQEGKTFEEIIAGLKQETELLSLNSRQRSIRGRVLRAESQIIGGELLPAQEAEITALSRTIEALDEEQSMLESLKTPQQKMAEAQAILNRLLSKGEIGLGQYNKALDDMKGAIKKVDAKSLTATQRLWIGGFEDLGDALGRWAGEWRTTKDNLIDIFRQVSDAFIAEMTRMAAYQIITKPLTATFFPALSSAGGGGGGVDGSIVDTPGDSAAGKTGGYAITPGEQNDSADAARTTGGGATVVMHIHNPPRVDEFMRSQNQLASRAAAASMRARRRNG